MKDLKKLVDECEKDLNTIGIKYGKVRNWSVNTRAKYRWGQCKYVTKGVYDISIAQSLLADEIPDQAVKNTIVHELLHTVKDCNGHKGKWKLLAQKVNKLLPQYNINRITSREEKGMEREKTECINRYKLVCTGCNKAVYREKYSSLVKNPEKYRCTKCGKTFKREW